MNIQETIDFLRLHRIRKAGEKTIHEGFGSLRGIDWPKFKAAGWFNQPKWASCGFREVWVNNNLFATLTYCEGDLILAISPNKASFEMAMEDAERFYKEN